MASTVLDLRSDWTPRLLKQRRAFELARRVEDSIPEPTKTYTVFETDTTQLTQLGLDLVEFDRELRRAAQIVAGTGKRSESLPAPLPVRRGGVTVREVDVNSTEMLVEAYGLVRDVLLSNPIQLLLAAQALRQNAGWVRVWFRDRLPGISPHGLREIREILLHGPPAGTREVNEITEQESKQTNGETDPDIRIQQQRDDGAALSIEMRGTHPSRIRRTRHVREHPGGIDYIETEEIEW